MSTVTGYLTVIVNGVKTETNFASLPYPRFVAAQRMVLAAMEEAEDWGILQALGVTPTGPEPGAGTGDVEFSYHADFAAGGTSAGSNAWHGIPEGAAAAIAAKLTAAAGYLTV